MTTSVRHPASVTDPSSSVRKNSKKRSNADVRNILLQITDQVNGILAADQYWNQSIQDREPDHPTVSGLTPRMPQQLEKKKVGVLGCTGSVGQRFSLLLSDHPYFELVAVGASSRSKGKKYKDTAAWKQTAAMPEAIGELVVTECEPGPFLEKEVSLVFSGLGSDIAGDVEKNFADQNIPIFSNAKNYRQDALTPLVVPTVNLSHLDFIPKQRELLGRGDGFIVCNSNCAVIGIVIPLAAIQSLGLISEISVVTSQALSGAGYPGVSAMDILDNVVPFISGEEDKLEPEAQKILGSLNASSATSPFEARQDLKISATCTRVNVTDGHMAFVNLKFKERGNVPSVEKIKEALKRYKTEVKELGCPSAPEQAIHVLEQQDRPQPRLDRDRGAGYSVSVGRVREDPSGLFDCQFVCLSHNTVIGAAGSSILNAEAVVLKGLIG